MIVDGVHMDKIEQIINQKIEKYELAVEFAVFEGIYTSNTANQANISLYEEYEEPVECKKFYNRPWWS